MLHVMKVDGSHSKIAYTLLEESVIRSMKGVQPEGVFTSWGRLKLKPGNIMCSGRVSDGHARRVTRPGAWGRDGVARAQAMQRESTRARAGLVHHVVRRMEAASGARKSERRPRGGRAPGAPVQARGRPSESNSATVPRPRGTCPQVRTHTATRGCIAGAFLTPNSNL